MRFGLLIRSVVGASLVFTAAGASLPTTTTLSPNPNIVYTTTPNNVTTLTATVTGSGSPTGTVTFQENGINLICGGGNPAPLSSGTATCSTAFNAEGSHVLTASYGGDSTFITSSGSANIFVQNHSTNSGTTYCNTGAVNSSGQSNIAYSSTSPYPSVIFVGDGVNTDITSSATRSRCS